MNASPHTLLLSLGSNRDKEHNMDQALRLLSHSFEGLSCSGLVETLPYGSLSGSASFLNQIVVAHTHLSADEVINRLKEIEKQLGRKPEDKAKGSIPIDIDLLQWDAVILKPEDLHRPYVQELINSLK